MMCRLPGCHSVMEDWWEMEQRSDSWCFMEKSMVDDEETEFGKWILPLARRRSPSPSSVVCLCREIQVLYISLEGKVENKYESLEKSGLLSPSKCVETPFMMDFRIQRTHLPSLPQASLHLIWLVSHNLWICLELRSSWHLWIVRES